MKTRKAQVTIFVIAALVVLASIAMFFAFRQTAVQQTSGTSEENPSSYLESCMENKVREAIGYVSLRGGYISSKPSKAFQFQDEPVINITYLCYNQNSYLACINQKPAFIDDLRWEIKEYVRSDVQDCFNGMADSFRKNSYEVSLDYEDFNITIVPEKVSIVTDSEITLTKSGQTISEEDIKAEIPSKMYEISLVVQEIVNQEARFCYAEISGISVFYPEFSIDRIKTDSLDNIYDIEHTESRERFRFAVRGCAIPPTL